MLSSSQYYADIRDLPVFKSALARRPSQPIWIKTTSSASPRRLARIWWALSPLQLILRSLMGPQIHPGTRTVQLRIASL
jgi:hypothetical protein